MLLKSNPNLIIADFMVSVGDSDAIILILIASVTAF